MLRFPVFGNSSLHLRIDLSPSVINGTVASANRAFKSMIRSLYVRKRSWDNCVSKERFRRREVVDIYRRRQRPTRFQACAN
jgi:hypothetical protein